MASTASHTPTHPETDLPATTSQVPNSHRVAILGAGPCGLYAARVLSKAGLKVTILEKADIPGGLATSIKHGQNFYDLGVHMLHSFDKEIFEDIKSLMGEERIEVQLDAKIRWAGSFYRYPLQFGDMIKGMNPFQLAIYSFALLATQSWYHLFPKTPTNARDALIQLYGYPLYRFFFRDFTHRYWGIHPRELSATFITTKMPRLTAVDVIKKALYKVGIKEKGVRAVESALLEETLHYSRTGAETMTRRLAAAVEQHAGTVIYGAEVSAIEHADGHATAVRYNKDGQEARLEFDSIISTIPVTALASSLDPAPPAEVTEAASQLRYKALAVYGMLVKKERCIDGLYIYYRDRAFHRVGEPKNAGLTVNPPDHTVLIVEMTCEVGDPKWQGSDAAKEEVFADLEAENICRREDVVEVNILRTPNGYPIFALGFEPHLEKVIDHINTIPNLHTAGRQGAFTYPNMHTAMRMGWNAAEKILPQKP
jgi:protoporphyrinogen oxidase